MGVHAQINAWLDITAPWTSRAASASPHALRSHHRIDSSLEPLPRHLAVGPVVVLLVMGMVPFERVQMPQPLLGCKLDSVRSVGSIVPFRRSGRAVE